MKRHVSATLTVMFAFAPLAYGEEKTAELTDPLEIIKKVDAAAKAVKTVRYHVELSASGAAKPRTPEVSGDYLMTGFAGMGPEKFTADVKYNMPGSDDRKHLTVGSDGENYYLVDHDTKKAYEDIDPMVVGRRGGIVMFAAMLEYVHPAPFSDEINGTEHELLGSKTVAGEPCYEVRVVYNDSGAEATWCFSKNDFLPRSRVDKVASSSGEKGARQRIVSKVDVNPKVDDEAFKLKLPDGYEKIDDFAPDQ